MSKFGFHRVVSGNSTPQAADKLNVSLESHDDTVIDVFLLNLDSTSASQLHCQAKEQNVDVTLLISQIVQARGKMHNPVTNSGGVMVGKVVRVSKSRVGELQIGQTVIPLCSMTAIPLLLSHISRVDGHQVHCKGEAFLYDSLVLAVVPPTQWSIEAVLAAVDVSRLVPQLRRTLEKEQPKSVACVGCGRSGLLALTLCREMLPYAKLIALDIMQENLDNVEMLKIGALCARVDATNPKDMLEAVSKFEPEGCDLVLNLVSVQNTEAGTALIAKGTIIYFSMAVSFPRAVLSTDVKGAPLNVQLGAGVFPDQCTSTLDVMKRNPVLAELFAPESERPFYRPMNSSGTQMRKFAEFCGLSSQVSFGDLHRWTLAHQDAFYEKLLQFTGIKLKYDFVSKKVGPLLSQVEWFGGSQVNHAQVLMRHCRPDNQATAFLCHVEGSKVVQRVTYGQLGRDVAILHHRLKKDMGLQKGMRTAAILPNVYESVVCMLSVTSIGAIWSSQGPDLGVDVLLSRFGQINPTLLFVCSSYAYGGKRHNRVETITKVIAALPSVQHVILIPDHSSSSVPLSWIKWDDVMSQPTSQPIQFEPMRFCDPVYIMFTSGTTGPPKCIVQGFGVTLNHLKEHMLHFDVRPCDVVFTYSSLSWMMWTYLLGCLAIGSALVLFDGSPFIPSITSMWTDIIERDSVSLFFASARYLDALAKDKFQPASSSLRFISSTGSPLSPLTAAYFKSALPNVPLASGSGGTELNGSLCLANPLSPVFGGGEICGPPLGMDVDVLSVALERITEAEGELACFSASPNMPLFFLNDEKSSRYRKSYYEKTELVWMHGDYSVRTKRGGFFILGRSDATLNPGGVRIGTRDYYSVVESISGVLDSIVVAIKNSDADEDVALFVVLAPQCNVTSTFSEIRKQIREKLSPKHVPKHLVSVSSVPVNLNMKKMEILVRQLVEGTVSSSSTPLSNPESCQQYIEFGKQLRSARAKL